MMMENEVMIWVLIGITLNFADLSQVEDRINSKSYKTLSDFIGDMTKIFDNCRYYNPKESQFYKLAETLEAFFLQKIKQFREISTGSGSV